jgi:hypothetical protein
MKPRYGFCDGFVKKCLALGVNVTQYGERRPPGALVRATFPIALDLKIGEGLCRLDFIARKIAATWVGFGQFSCGGSPLTAKWSKR